MDANDYIYFTFIDDYSWYLCLLRSKDEVLYSFKVFKVEVKLQWRKKIKIVRLDKCGECYVAYTKWISTWSICEISLRTWDCFPIHYAFLSKLEWCGRKKKSNFSGYNEMYKE